MPSVGSGFPGRSSVWLERTVRVREAAGSSPVVPIDRLALSSNRLGHQIFDLIAVGSNPRRVTHGNVAQLAEHSADNREAGGSSPPVPTLSRPHSTEGQVFR